MTLIDIAFIFALMGLGLWFETINGKHGVVDEWLTWLPMGASGVIWVGLERAFG
jgi:hypothetical protein